MRKMAYTTPQNRQPQTQSKPQVKGAAVPPDPTVSTTKIMGNAMKMTARITMKTARTATMQRAKRQGRQHMQSMTSPATSEPSELPDVLVVEYDDLLVEPELELVLVLGHTLVFSQSNWRLPL